MPSTIRPVRSARKAAVVFCAMVAMSGTVDAAMPPHLPCVRPEDRLAIDAHMLQMELTVGALTCKERKRYGAFVARFEPLLIQKGKRLRRYFSQIEDGETALNDFVTELANEVSLRRHDWGAGYCSFVSQLFSYVLAISPSRLTAYASTHPYAVSRSIKRCR